MKYITIYESLQSFEVSIIKNILEENNINCFLPDGATASSSGIAGLGIRGMRVQVGEDEKDIAITLLRERGFTGIC